MDWGDRSGTVVIFCYVLQVVLGSRGSLFRLLAMGDRGSRAAGVECRVFF